MQDTMRKAGALAGAALMASAGALSAATIADAAPAPEQAAPIERSLEVTTFQANAKAYEVVGSFMYAQDVVADNATIRTTFSKAAAALCQSLPQYGAQTAAPGIAVSSPAGSYAASVAQLGAEDEAQSYQLSCSCASNVAGGGAVANANVQGVSLASVAQQAQAVL